MNTKHNNHHSISILTARLLDAWFRRDISAKAILGLDSILLSGNIIAILEVPVQVNKKLFLTHEDLAATLQRVGGRHPRLALALQKALLKKARPLKRRVFIW